MNTTMWEGNVTEYSTVETLLDEVSRNMAASNISRYSRGGSGQRTSGSMRVVKPGSTSNSPRSSIGLGRRMTDGAYRRRLAMVDQHTFEPSKLAPNGSLRHPTQRISRPVSWHPASHVPYETPCQATHQAAPTYPSYSLQPFDLPPTPVTYSGYTSPAPTFSPLSTPYIVHDQQSQHTYVRPHSYHPMGYEMHPPLHTQSSQIADIDTSMYSHFDWNNFASDGFENSTAPPTPENFLPIQHPEAALPADAAIQYQSLDDEEGTGEELIGMGLYDTPELTKFPGLDPHLDNYRSMMMSHLLGTPYSQEEQLGKGLKLEETWNPPQSDDEEEASSETDGEGEEDDDNEAAADDNYVTKLDVDVPRVNHNGNGYVTFQQDTTGVMGHQFSQGGWL